MHRIVGILSLLVSLFCSAWLLSTRYLGGTIWDAMGELASFFYVILVIPAFSGALVLSVFHAVRRWNEDRRFAALPLMVNLAALGLFLPLDRELEQRDFYNYLAERTEIVKRIESGELWSGSPLIQLVSLPREYPRAVSNGVGQRQVMVYRDDALNVVFSPMSGLGERTAFLYRSSDDPPSMPNPHLPNAIRSEPLSDNWYRVVFRYS